MLKVSSFKVEVRVQNNKRLFEDVLENFFDNKQIKEFSKIVLSSKPTPSEKRTVGSIEKQQINLEIDDYLEINLQVDLLITFAQFRLDKNKFIELLFLLGRLIITSGEFNTAIYIYEKVLNEIGEDKALLNLTAPAQLALGEIFNRLAKWQLSLSYIKKAYDTFKRLNEIKGCANCENLLGTIHGERGELHKAKRHFERSVAMLENSDDNSFKGKIEINLGIISNIFGDFETAISNFRLALLYFEKIKDLQRVAEIRHNMGMVYTKKNDLTSAIREFDRSILFSMRCGNMPSLGLAYLSKAYIYVLQNDFYLAEAFADKAMELCNKTNDKLSIADIYKTKGIIQRKLNMYDLAESYLLTSLRLNKELQNELNLAETSIEIGRLYKETDRTNESKQYFNNAIKYYKKIKAVNELASIVREFAAIS